MSFPTDSSHGYGYGYASYNYAPSAQPVHIPRSMDYLSSKECEWQKRCRFPEKTSEWWSSQLVCQPRPLSLVTHASRESVWKLEQMADLHWIEPQSRPGHSLYVYYTYRSAAPSPQDTAQLAPQYHEVATTAEEDHSCATPRARVQTPHFQFPPLSPPASALPIPSCLGLYVSGESTNHNKAGGKNANEHYAYTPGLVPALLLPPSLMHGHWPPTAPPASSLPIPSWYSPAVITHDNNNNNTPIVGSKCRQDVKERRRARRSSTASTPHPPSASPVLCKHIGYSPYGYASSDGSMKGRKVRRSCFTPKDTNRQMVALTH